MDRTVKIQLKPEHEHAQLLRETGIQFTSVFNDVCAYGWHNGEKNGVKLHHATYYHLREQYPSLNSNVLIQGRIKATEALKSAFDRKAKGRKTGQPQSVSCPIRYNERTYTLDWIHQSVNLSTIAGRVQVPFLVPPYSSKYAGGTVSTADLIFRNGTWWLHVVVNLPDPDIPFSDEVIGIDLGLNRPAVTSNRHFLGRRHWKEVDHRRFRLKRKLQSNGTKSAKRHLKKLSGRSLRFHRDCDHVLSRRIVQHAIPGSTLVLENLTHIRSRAKMKKHTETQRRMHSWSFAQFYSFLSYKAQEYGMQVVKIDPRHTSQTCSRCGYQARNNRRSQSVFHCRSCGYQLNADLNASYNIRDKFCLAQDGRPVLSGSLSSGLSSHASA